MFWKKVGKWGVEKEENPYEKRASFEEVLRKKRGGIGVSTVRGQAIGLL